MSSKTKIIGAIAIVIVVTSIYFLNTSSQKGALLPIKGSFDLITGRVSAVPAQPGDTEINVGDGVTLSAVIGNRSVLRVPGFTSGFYIGEETTPSLLTSTGPIDANRVETENMGWIANREGSIQIRACADTGSIIRETNESNNCASTTITVAPQLPPPPPSSTSTFLTVEDDVVTNIRSTQIVAGATNVTFAAFRFFARGDEDVRIQRIRVRNIGTNINGIASIGIYSDGVLINDDPTTTPNEGILGADGSPNAVLFDYSTRPYIIPRDSFKVFTIKANTVYNATSGQTVKFEIDLVDAVGVNSNTRIVPTLLNARENALHRLYPTKLNFAWIAPASTTLLTGRAVEVGRFTLGADVANANNPGASVAVTALNLTNLSTATLVNFTLNDVTQNVNVATAANSSSFSSTVAGGVLSTLTLQQGETRTFKILADAETTAGYQTAQFRFNAGTESLTTGSGSATWSVTNNGVTSNSVWTILAGGVDGLNSTTLVSASTPTRSP